MLSTDYNHPAFIDIFAGAGGLSLGLMNAGWDGLFAIEKSPMAFATLSHNLIEQMPGTPRYRWADWLPRKEISIEAFLSTYRQNLDSLKHIPLLAGGPPCQGFSFSGRRRIDDERNRLFEKYLELVAQIEPQMLLIENVRGFAASFKTSNLDDSADKDDEDLFNASEELQQRLTALNYKHYVRRSIMAKDYGIPQLRPRYVVIAIHNDFLANAQLIDPFDILKERRNAFLTQLNLPVDREITTLDAIGDLEREHGKIICTEPNMSNFFQGQYGPVTSDYQRLMRKTRDGKIIDIGVPADSHRFANHKADTEERFSKIIAECRPGMNLSNLQREEIGIRKRHIALLSAYEACHTLTSLPDDLIHYKEPRIMTVREYARIQSFPDWFEFKSNYTTGSKRRREDVPRYTQVANAVPPLLAQAIGSTLKEVYTSLTTHNLETQPFALNVNVV